ncbi:polysaccharide deacetylase family protein [Solibacillus sp. MA9]|uniref:Polysaccharide deacetylase family protein n=1 Tax=Solibacillus palustris TaxID=2908203 RepID=A0ABS9UG17_9BACL|nr:polysaccharide deacetylase family protein [Solibacillus sp. MA9]MCH7323302.1 polysaccharide deacetylase family protein [Solibacillus sp. MA9]
MKKTIIILAIIYFVTFLKLSPTNGYSNEKIPILMYHHLEKNLNNNAVISPENFENQIKYLKVMGYNTITAQQLYDYLNGSIQLPQNPVLITFDDGYLSNYEMAYPILKKYNMHAEVFVITSRILEKGVKTSYSNEIPKMNWEQLREMKDYITVQSHSWDSHYKLKSNIYEKKIAALSGPVYINGKMENQKEYEERVKNDLIRSRKIIKEKLGYEPIAISYPFGITSNDAMNLAKAAGFKLGFLINNKSIKKSENKLALSRITVNGNDSGEELIKKIKKG